MATLEHVLIIGGGIGGPVLALFLRKLGIASTVYEAHPGPSNIGGCFQIAPNGMNVLAAIGLAERVAAGSISSKDFCFRSHRGRTLARFENGRPDRCGRAASTMMRSHVQAVILDELTRQGIRIEYGKRLSRPDVGAEGKVVAHFEDGTSARGDLLVGADGVRSRTRALALPGSLEPRYTGMIGLGGIVPMAAVPMAAPEDLSAITIAMGPNGSFGYCGLLDDQRSPMWGWWVHHRREEELTKEAVAAIATDELRSMLLRQYEGWFEPVPSFLAQSTSILRIPIYDLDPLPAWHGRATVLIGDAAHAMSPSAGQGASLALEDAMFLAHALGDAALPLEARLASFEGARRPRVERIAARARQHDARQRGTLGPVGSWMREQMMSLMMPVVGERSLRSVYEYRVPWNEPAVLGGV